jgi:hypothetical protein
MKRVNNILKLIGAIITSFCFAIAVISVIGMFQCKDQQHFVMYLIYFMSFLGLGITSIFATLDEI